MAYDAWIVTVADQAVMEQVKVLGAELTLEKAQVRLPTLAVSWLSPSSRRRPLSGFPQSRGPSSATVVQHAAFVCCFSHFRSLVAGGRGP